MNTFRLIISTPLGNAYDAQALEISLKGSEGELAVRAGHIPFACATRKGEVKITTSTSDVLLAFAGDGILNVTSEKVILLCGKLEIEHQK